MKIIVFILALMTVATSMAQMSTGREYCSDRQLHTLRSAFEDMVAESAAQAFKTVRVGTFIGNCEPYSLQQIAKRNVPMNAAKPFCGLVLLTSADPKLAMSQAAWILDNLGTSYKTKRGVELKFCGRMSSGFGPR